MRYHDYPSDARSVVNPILPEDLKDHLMASGSAPAASLFDSLSIRYLHDSNGTGGAARMPHCSRMHRSMMDNEMYVAWYYHPHYENTRSLYD